MHGYSVWTCDCDHWEDPSWTTTFLIVLAVVVVGFWLSRLLYRPLPPVYSRNGNRHS